jgi:hypothetical protein
VGNAQSCPLARGDEYTSPCGEEHPRPPTSMGSISLGFYSTWVPSSMAACLAVRSTFCESVGESRYVHGCRLGSHGVRLNVPDRPVEAGRSGYVRRAKPTVTPVHGAEREAFVKALEERSDEVVEVDAVRYLRAMKTRGIT